MKWLKMETINDLDFYKNFNSLFEKGYSYNTINKEIVLDDIEKSTAFLQGHNISFEVRRNRLYLSKSALPFSFFISIKEFAEEVTEAETNRNIYLLKYDSVNSFVFLFPEKITYVDFQEAAENYLVENAKCYFQLIEFFREKSINSNDGFEFVDHFSLDTRRITFNSYSEKMRTTLIYNRSGVTILNHHKDYRSIINEFFDSFSPENKNFPIFLKAAIIKILGNSTDESIYSFFTHLPKIIREAQINFNVYLHDLSLEKIKTEYENYKSKYFLEQTSILNKLSNQIITLPLSVAASTFAIYKLKESTFAIIFIIAGLVSVQIYLNFIISIYWRDIRKIASEIENDFVKLSSNSFFGRHTDELNGFKTTKNWLIGRCNSLGFSLKFFQVMSLLFTICLLFYGWHLVLPVKFDVPMIFYLAYALLAIVSAFDFTFQDNN